MAISKDIRITVQHGELRCDVTVHKHIVGTGGEEVQQLHKCRVQPRLLNQKILALRKKYRTDNVIELE